MKKIATAATAALLLACGSAGAAELALSIGVRETGGTGAAFSDGGSAGGIEWVNLDGQPLTADGTWQLFTFTPSTDTLTAFAGTTANGVLDTEWGVLEHIRIRNTDGITAPVQLWIDDVTNTSREIAVEGFEGFAVGDEVMFHEPQFSGSTTSNIDDTGTSAVSEAEAKSGSRSYQVDFQFVDDIPTRWIRLTSFNVGNLPNPLLHLDDPGAATAPTISFWAAAVVPEPASAAILAVAGLGLCARRRPRRMTKSQ